MSYLQLKNLTASYDKEIVLNNLSLDIKKGELLSLLGSSGCGKTTTLRIVSGFLKPISGSVVLDDMDISQKPPNERGFGYVFQSYALFPHLTVEDNVGFGLKQRKVRSDQIKVKVDEMLDLVDLSDFRSRRPKELSGGQKQRVALARAMAIDPGLLLLDEPLSNLDAKLRASTRARIVGLQRQLGTTTLYVTHDQVEAMTMGHRIAVLNQGRLQQLGTPMELYRWPSNLFVAQFIGSPPMNVLPVQVGAGSTLILGDKRLTPEGPIAAALPSLEGNTLTAGIRPDHLQVAPATNRNLPAEVSHSEVLGNEQLVTCRLLDGDHLVQVRAEPSLSLNPGCRIHLAADPQGWRLFDADGEAISLPEPPPSRGPEPALPPL